ncbi:MAG: hypothetical protein ABFC24_08395 [Methanoregulaceae archaeon]
MANLKISPEKAILLMNERIEAIQTVQKNKNGLEYYDFIGWCSKTWPVIDEIYGSEDPHSEELRTMGLSNCSCNANVQALLLAEAYHSRLLDFIREIEDSVKIPPG